ncbi:MAG TPA: hypothetical protein VEB03_02010 [Candidatus Nanoarchaeia archaeon]|nr:hypothetical protein [Candidatus Nanoarchaeia archaeon]
MLKFTLASRHMETGTRERFFYEWSHIHVALMLTTPSVMRAFKRYVQHFNVPDVRSQDLFYPLSSEQWESFAEHHVDRYDDVVKIVREPDYVARMQPHKFSSHRFITSISEFQTAYQRPDFRSGGVKLLHFLKKSPDFTQADFRKRMLNVRAPKLAKAFSERPGIRKYVVNTLLDVDPAIFKGTLFEFGSTGLYAGIEELWLDNAPSSGGITADKEVADAIRTTEQGAIDSTESISMVVVERVVWDFVTPGATSPVPAILNPDSLESMIDGQGYRPWELQEIAAAVARD